MDPCGILRDAVDACALPFEFALILELLFPMGCIGSSYLDIQTEQLISLDTNIFVVFSSRIDS